MGGRLLGDGATLWVVVMIVFAGWTVQRRVKHVPRLWLLSMGAFGASALVTLGAGLVLVITLVTLEVRQLFHGGVLNDALETECPNSPTARGRLLQRKAS